MKKIPKTILLLLFTFGLIEANAQQAVLTSGKDANGSGGTASYSIGQLDYVSIESAAGFVYEGVQQPLNSSTLPVTNLDLQGIKKENKVILNWQTSTEINSNQFIVQKSKDGLTFLTIGEVSAAGNSTILQKYSIDDLQPFAGINYYRIKQVDNDGKFIYSKVVTIDFASKEDIAIVYPNPSSENITLKIKSYLTRSLSYFLYDNKGALIISNKVINNETIIHISNLSPSNYFLKITDQNKELKTFKIIKLK